MNIKKVYVVTCGCYSDYGIDEIFSDKDKAEEYVDLRNKGNYDDGYGYRVEEYVMDSLDFDSLEVVEVKVIKHPSHKDNYKFSLKTMKAIKGEDVETKFYIDKYGDKSITITLIRPVKDRSLNDLNKTYRKVVQDLFFMIESNFEYYENNRGLWDLSKKTNEEIE